jgi:hypothetical protein
MNRAVHGCVFAAVLAFAASAGAQVQPAPTLPGQIPPTPRTQERPREASGSELSPTPAVTVTVEGCLVREQDMPGRKPKAAEKNDASDDYILINSKVVTGMAPPPSPSGPRVVAQMYKVDGINNGQLKYHLGRRVQIDGSFDHVHRTATSTEEGTSADDLVEIEGSTIKEVTGDCPAK